ncbi:MAG: hypothetical protein U1F68_18940 [Gammaproteobacteria bacterium]
MTNNTVLAIVHQKTSQTGRIGAKLEARGYAIEMRCPMLGHGLPERLDDYAAVLVMGGPMSANDDHLLGIRAELDWLPVVLGAAKPYLGVCLGAQLLARALGARVSPHDEGLTEVGYFPVYATAGARCSAIASWSITGTARASSFPLARSYWRAVGASRGRRFAMARTLMASSSTRKSPRRSWSVGWRTVALS